MWDTALPAEGNRSNGAHRVFNVCFTARITGGALRISEESTDLRFVVPEDLAALPMHHTQRLRIGHFLERRAAPFLG